MTIQIELSSEGEVRLRDRAREAGGEPEVVAALLLEQALNDVPDPDAELTAEQWAAIESGIARGDADFAAGRYSSAEDVYARLEKQTPPSCCPLRTPQYWGAGGLSGGRSVYGAA